MPDVDLVSLVRQCTGVLLPKGAIEACMLRWVAPHAIRVSGLRLLVDVRYDTLTILGNAVHELLHPPFPDDHAVWETLDALASDPFLSARFNNRDPDAGYNTWRSYVEEDAAQALDQLLCERLGIARRSALERWIEADDGMHVLAALLHRQLADRAYDPETCDYGTVVNSIATEWMHRADDLEMQYSDWCALRHRT